MIDLKIQQYAESSMKPTAEVARILQDKRATGAVSAVLRGCSNEV